MFYHSPGLLIPNTRNCMKRNISCMALSLTLFSCAGWAQTISPAAVPYQSDSLISTSAAPRAQKIKWVTEWRKAIEAKPLDEKKIESIIAEINSWNTKKLEKKSQDEHKAFAATAGEKVTRAESGEETARELNSRWNKIVPDCGGKPAYYCSGVVVRSNEYYFGAVLTWVLEREGLEKGILATSYIRQDNINGQMPIYKFDAIGYGIALYPRETQEYFTRCIFPTNGNSWANQDHGCGDMEDVRQSDDVDNSNCEAKGVHTAEEWLETDDIYGGCSFSSHHVKTFNEAIRAQNLYHIEYPSMWNELVVNGSPGNWDSDNPANDPIQALWYHKGMEESDVDGILTGLNGAQNEQLAYFEISGKWIPIVFIDGGNLQAPFGYSAADQVVGPR